MLTMVPVQMLVVPMLLMFVMMGDHEHDGHDEC